MLSSYGHVCAHIGTLATTPLLAVSDFRVVKRWKEMCGLELMIYGNTFFRVLFKGHQELFLFLCPGLFTQARITDKGRYLESLKGNDEEAMRALCHLSLSCGVWGPDSVIARLVQLGNFFMQQIIPQYMTYVQSPQPNLEQGSCRIHLYSFITHNALHKRGNRGKIVGKTSCS